MHDRFFTEAIMQLLIVWDMTCDEPVGGVEITDNGNETAKLVFDDPDDIHDGHVYEVRELTLSLCGLYGGS